VAELFEVAVDDPLDVAVELRSQRAAGKAADPGKARRQDLADVALQPDVGAPADGRPPAPQKLGQAHARNPDATLAERHRTQPHADDPPGSGVRRRV